MDRRIGLVVAAVSAGCALGARADVLAVSRDSSINVGLITVGPAPAPVSSTLIDSAADLTLSGAAAYADGFGRDFAGSYASIQDVQFSSIAISAQLSQSADTTLISAGNPASTVFSVDVFNRYESSFTVTEETTLRLTLDYTGSVTLGSAADRVDFRINTQFGGLFVMPLAIPAGNTRTRPLFRTSRSFPVRRTSSSRKVARSLAVVPVRSHPS